MILVFDFDGTLHKTETIYGYAVRKALSEIPDKVPEDKLNVTDEQLSKYLGVNADEMWQDFLPHLSEKDRKTIIPKVGSYLNEAINNGKSLLYDGTEDMLNALKAKGHTMVILSNCTINYMESQKKANNLERWFDNFYCCEKYGNQPKEEIFDYIKKDYPGDYVVIGDRASDIKVALKHSLKSIGCAYGYGSDNELSCASVIVNSPEELLEAIEKMNTSPTIK